MPFLADHSYGEPGSPDDGTARRRRRRLDGMLCLVAWLSGLAGLAATRLGQLWTGFDVISNFTLHFAVMALAFFVGWLMPRGRLLSASVLFVTGITAIGLWPHLASEAAVGQAVAAPGERAMTVAIFNTLRVNDEADAIKAEVTRLDADVIALIELGPSGWPMIGQLRERYPYQANCGPQASCELAILSKFPIIDSEASGRWRGPRFIRVKLGAEAGGLTVFGLHATRFPRWQRQFQQMAAMADRLAATGGHKLVMGDFNATPFSRLLSDFTTSTSLTRLTFLPSWPASIGLPQLSIDHVLVSPGIRPLGPARIGAAAGSDHYPVIVPISVPLGADTP